MSARIRELEEALAEKSDDTHRLLPGNNPIVSQSSMGQASSDSPRVGASSPREPETDSFIDAFGISNRYLAVWFDDASIRDTYNRYPWRNEFHE